MPASVSCVCCGPKPLENPSPGCIVKRLPQDNGSQHKRRFIRLALPDIPGIFLPQIHSDCSHNQLVAASNRVCGEVPLPTEDGLKELAVAANRLARMLPMTSEQGIYDMPESYSGRKRTRYLLATGSLLDYGLFKADSYIKMFVKTERFQAKPDKPNPDPRAIQFRGAKYCVALSQYLKPIEHHLYALNGVSRGVPSSRTIAKGLNQVERASLLVEKANHFEAPVFIELDASRFDKHVSTGVLKLEHRVYQRCNPDPTFAALLKRQLVNKCFSSLGMCYTTAGKRMSGDMNTALGNCVIMCFMMMSYMSWCRKWDFLDDGDDSVLIVESEDLARVEETVKTVFRTYGFVMKVEHITRNVFDVEFCQSKIIEVQQGLFKFTRNPLKVMSCALSGVKLFDIASVRARLVHSIGICELVLNLGVPVLQSYALAILRNCGTERTLALDEESAIMIRVKRELRSLGIKTLSRVQPKPITDCARDSFERAFGISVRDQILYEQKLEQWVFTLEGSYNKESELDVATWTQVVADYPEVYAL